MQAGGMARLSKIGNYTRPRPSGSSNSRRAPMQRISPSDLQLPSALVSHAQESAATPAGANCPICDGAGWLAERMPGSISVSAVPCECRLRAHQQLREREKREERILLLAQLDSELGGKLSRC